MTPDPAAIRGFADAAGFAAWLATHHATDSEIWLRIAKRQSGIASVSYAEALDEALCWGWIDGLRKGLDPTSFLQRFTPRGKTSIWSARNVTHIERLAAAGRLHPPGHAAVEAAKADGRWDRAYPAGREMQVPADLLAAIAANAAAQATYATLNRQNLFALAFRLGNLKTAAGRAKKIAAFVEMLARGETLHPNGKAGKAP